MSDNLPIRNKPKQARSRQRYEHILQIAAEMFAEQGYERVTTNHIAAEANVSIGSLYRFFPNKDVILAELVENYLADKKALFLQTIDMEQPIAESFGKLVSVVMQFEQKQANFQRIFVTVDSAQQQLHRTFVAWMEELFVNYYPDHADHERTLMAHVAVGIIKGVLPLQAEPFAVPSATVAQELSRALTAYVQQATNVS